MGWIFACRRRYRPPAARQSLAWAWISILLIITTIAIYGRGVSGGFVDWDDSELITHNPMLRPGAAGLLAHAWAAPVNGLYAPLTYAVYALIAAIARAAGSPLDPGWFHATSLLLHVIGGLILFHWLRRLCGRDGPAVIGAAVWLLHPIQAEPVAWASGLNSVLGGVLAIAALALATEGVQSTPRRRWPLLIGSTALAAASLCAKPSGVLLPAMLIAVHRLILRRPWKETLLLAGAWAAVLLPFAVDRPHRAGGGDGRSRPAGAGAVCGRGPCGRVLSGEGRLADSVRD